MSRVSYSPWAPRNWNRELVTRRPVYTCGLDLNTPPFLDLNAPPSQGVSDITLTAVWVGDRLTKSPTD